MNTRLIVGLGLGLLPLVTACSLLETNPVPPNPALTGVSAQNAAWQEQIKRPRGAQAPRFEPLTAAREAVDAARAQAEVENHDGESLRQAQEALDEAETGWSEIADQRRPAPDRLADVAQSAHRAQRLAEIARYTAVREIHLEELIAANDQLEARRESAATNPGAGGEVRPVSAESRELIGQKVIPEQFGDVSFETGTARMQQASQGTIRELVELLRQHPTVGVAIFGHTDNIAPSDASLERFVQANPEFADRSPSRSEKVSAFNLALSAARARAVAQTLVDNGIPARRIGARGFGDTQPVASNDTQSGRRENRRIEAVIVPGPDSPEARQARGGS